MIAASLNCNKRLGNAKVLDALQRWLEDNNVDLFLAQEPWVKTRGAAISLRSYRPLGGNERVFAWRREGRAIAGARIVESHWQQLDVDYLTIHNVYLDAYRQTTRGIQLAALRDGLHALGNRPQIIVGDFNLAPDPEDGLWGQVPSNFNGPVDRGPFKELLVGGSLIDVTSREISGKQEFSINRVIRNTPSCFRCDLCLVSDYLFATGMVSAAYDHAVRDSVEMSDHSALVLDLPLTLAHKREAYQMTLFPAENSVEADEALRLCPHKTAMARRSPSVAAQLIGEGDLVARLGGIQKILDYGCGRGTDVEYYQSKGFEAVGYDPYASFGYAALPQGESDLVTVVFVINVLPNCWERMQVIAEAAKFLKSGGYMLLIARSPHAIAKEATRKRWPQHNDGYWSHKGKGMFQRGISTQEMVLLARRAGLVAHPLSESLDLGRAVSHLLAVKT